MCSTSMIADHYGDDLTRRYGISNYDNYLLTVPRYEFDALKREVESIKSLLKKAAEYDKDTNQPHCEKDEKVALLKRIAELVGVDLSDVFTTTDGKV